MDLFATRNDRLLWICCHEAEIGTMNMEAGPDGATSRIFFSYAGYPVLDALKMCDCPIVEVHISNIHRREEAWRANSLMTAAATGMITGLGPHGYVLAVRHIASLLRK